MTDYYADQNLGNDSTGDGSVSTPWKTITGVIDTSDKGLGDGDTLWVRRGASAVEYTGPTFNRGGTADSPLRRVNT